jgi:hypothetical protein
MSASPTLLNAPLGNGLELPMTRISMLALVVAVALGSTACSNKEKNVPRRHSTYSPHYHDKNGMPHVKPGHPPPPPHNHHHGPTWK